MREASREDDEDVCRKIGMQCAIRKTEIETSHLKRISFVNDKAVVELGETRGRRKIARERGIVFRVHLQDR